MTAETLQRLAFWSALGQMTAAECLQIERDLVPYPIGLCPPGVNHSSFDDHSTVLEYIEQGVGR